MLCIEQGIEEHEREGRPEHVLRIEQGIEKHEREGRPEHALNRAGNREAREGRETRTCTV